MLTVSLDLPEDVFSASLTRNWDPNGSRGEADTFPYGYFKVWTLHTNTGRFERV